MTVIALVVVLIFFVVPGALVFIAGRTDDGCEHNIDCGDVR